MKVKILFIVALISMCVLFSCSSPSERRIKNITDSNYAWEIYRNNPKSHLGKIAHERWKQLMKQKINKITDINKIWEIYSSNIGKNKDEIANLAYRKYKKMGGKK